MADIYDEVRHRPSLSHVLALTHIPTAWALRQVWHSYLACAEGAERRRVLLEARTAAAIANGGDDAPSGADAAESGNGGNGGGGGGGGGASLRRTSRHPMAKRPLKSQRRLQRRQSEPRTSGTAATPPTLPRAGASWLRGDAESRRRLGIASWNDALCVRSNASAHSALPALTHPPPQPFFCRRPPPPPPALPARGHDQRGLLPPLGRLPHRPPRRRRPPVRLQAARRAARAAQAAHGRRDSRLLPGRGRSVGRGHALRRRLPPPRRCARGRPLLRRRLPLSPLPPRPFLPPHQPHGGASRPPCTGHKASLLTPCPFSLTPRLSRRSWAVRGRASSPAATPPTRRGGTRSRWSQERRS